MPVVFAPPDFMLFPDVPKIVLLRVFTGLIGLLWVAEWALKSQNDIGHAEGTLWERFLTLLKESPAHWVLLAATSFLIVNVISTLLSPSISVSLWGANPGRDGYGLYNTFSHYLLFLVIATRLKTKSQLWRLLAVITLATTASAFYGILQHFQADPFDLKLNGERVIATFGNALFAGTFLVLAVPISAGLGLAHITKARSFPVVAMWAIVIGVQVLGLVFTFSRGPLATLAIVMVTWLLLIRLIAGNGVFLNSLSFLAPAVILVAGVLSVPAIPGMASNLISSLAEAQNVETSSVSEAPNTDVEMSSPLKEGKPAEGVGDAGTVSTPVQKSDTSTKREQETWTTSLDSTDVDAAADDETDVLPKLLDDLTASFRVDRTRADLRTWNLSGRLPLWINSAAIILDRPWHDPEKQGSLAVRHVFGYGPDMLRYALPLRFDAATLEPVNANPHNLFLLLLVELGILGFLSYATLIALLSLGTFLFVLKSRTRLSKAELVIYITLIMAIAARLLEQITGVARVSDTALFWTLVATLTALLLMNRADVKTNPTQIGQRPSISISKVCVVTLIAVIGLAVVWQKNVPYAEAASLSSDAVAIFNGEYLFTGLDLMDQAIFKAPDVEHYYILRAGMMNSFDTRNRDDLVDMATEQYAYTKLAADQNPLSHIAKGHLAVAAINLYQLGDASKGEEAVQQFQELTRMLPGYEPVYYQLANAHFLMGNYEDAVAVLDQFPESTEGRLRLTKISRNLRIEATNELQRSQKADAAP